MLVQTQSSLNVQIEIDDAFKRFLEAFKKLRELLVTTNSKDITCQFGEWLVEKLFDGVRAKNGIQKDWDVLLNNNLRIQVKSHAKAPTTKARWSNIKYDLHAEIEELIIVVFNQNYQIQEFYRAPWSQALPLIRKHVDKDRIFWDDLKDFKVELHNLPNQHVLTPFR